ncbi:hypothetical protein DFH08DRAFT_1024671 [Mycena albidolilacea]|uniref:Uncharacterized protein n=1 Tax=Mycena albidolilacea TaxID=1033008 RepID=A0AAD7ALQ8_9AGAR|nr:hypothetical protein DFH08DRAFT_1024671 [Mycena albidolilacea]
MPCSESPRPSRPTSQMISPALDPSASSEVHPALLVDPVTHSPGLVAIKLSRPVIEYVVDCVFETVDHALARSGLHLPLRPHTVNDSPPSSPPSSPAPLSAPPRSSSPSSTSPAHATSMEEDVDRLHQRQRHRSSAGPVPELLPPSYTSASPESSAGTAFPPPLVFTVEVLDVAEYPAR